MSSLLCLRTLEDIIDATQLAFAPLADTMRGALFDDSLTIDPETFTAYGVAPFNAGEVAAGGAYSTGGNTLGSKTWAIQAGTQRVRWKTGNLAFSGGGGVTGSFRYLLHYDDTLAGNNAFYLCDLGSLYTATAEDVTFVVDTNGWCRIRA